MSQPIECDDGRLLSLENLKPYGFFRYIDGLVIHPYTYGANPDTWTGHGYTKYNELVGLAEVIQYLKDWLTANGYPDMPLWATEFNFHSTVEKQVEWGIRECEILRDKGIHVSIWYCFWLPSDYPQFTGTLVNDDPTLSSKPMFNAYQEFISTL